MKNYICITCGTQFSATPQPPEACPVCEDERQYVNASGQQWTTMGDLRTHHKTVFKKKEEQLYGVGMIPKFGIGQRALLVQTDKGNVLWDCISLLDDTIVNLIKGLGVRGINGYCHLSSPLLHHYA